MFYSVTSWLVCILKYTYTGVYIIKTVYMQHQYKFHN